MLRRREAMGPLLTPTTELFYAFVNLDDTPVPHDLPEEDVFARAFKKGTITQSKPGMNDFDVFGNLISSQDSPQDLVFDDFLSKDFDESGDTSPSSEGSSLTKPSFNTPNYISTSSNQQQLARNGEQVDTNAIAARYFVPRSNNIPNGAEAVEAPQMYGPPTTNAPFLPANTNNFFPHPKQPRRRNTKRKLRTEEEEAAKRTAFLERNRMAAQKCRSRKKRQTNTLEDDLAVQEEINTRLKGEVAELAAELKTLKEVYIQCEQECRHARAKEEAGRESPTRAEKEQVEDGAPVMATSPEPKEAMVEAMDVS